MSDDSSEYYLTEETPLAELSLLQGNGAKWAGTKKALNKIVNYLLNSSGSSEEKAIGGLYRKYQFAGGLFSIDNNPITIDNAHGTWSEIAEGVPSNAPSTTPADGKITLTEGRWVVRYYLGLLFDAAGGCETVDSWIDVDGTDRDDSFATYQPKDGLAANANSVGFELTGETIVEVTAGNTSDVVLQLKNPGPSTGQLYAWNCRFVAQQL